MSRTKLILAGLLALLVVGVVATASTSTPASASGSCMKVGTPSYCIEGVPLVSASENAEGTSGSAILKATIGGMTSEIKCATGKSAGTIEGGVAGAVGKSKIKITFETCKLIAPEHCKLTSADEEKIKTTELMGELEVSGGKILDKLEPKGSAAFAGVSIEGETTSCVIAEPGIPETYSVTGSQLCEVDSSKTAAETEAEKHKLICKDAGSTNLRIGGNPAEIADETMAVELSGAKAHDHWSVKET
jgi:outer membrane lipoprotein SlyB